MRSHVWTLTLALIFTILSNSGFAEDDPHPWEKFGVGTYVKYARVRASGEIGAYYTYTLKEKNNGEVKITTTISLLQPSGDFKDINTKDYPYQFSPRGDRDRSYYDSKITKRLTTPAGTFQCFVTESKQGDGGKVVYYCSDDVPGGFVMSEMFDKDGATKSKLELAEVQIK